MPMKRPLSDASHSAAVNSGSNTSSGMTGSDSSAESPPKIMSTANAPPLSVCYPLNTLLHLKYTARHTKKANCNAKTNRSLSHPLFVKGLSILTAWIRQCTGQTL